MKKLILLAVFFQLLCVTGFSQIYDLKITNNSPCRVYFTLNVSDIPGTFPSASPSCATGYTSSIISLAPNSAIYYSTNVGSVNPIPGLLTGYYGYINSATIYDASPSCTGSTLKVGETACGYTSTGNLVIRNPVSCTFCANVNFKWITTSPLNSASLDIN